MTDDARDAPQERFGATDAEVIDSLQEDLAAALQRIATLEARGFRLVAKGREWSAGDVSMLVEHAQASERRVRKLEDGLRNIRSRGVGAHLSLLVTLCDDALSGQAHRADP